jgi:hypothetical protein
MSNEERVKIKCSYIPLFSAQVCFHLCLRSTNVKRIRKRPPRLLVSLSSRDYIIDETQYHRAIGPCPALLTVSN